MNILEFGLGLRKGYSDVSFFREKMELNSFGGQTEMNATFLPAIIVFIMEMLQKRSKLVKD